MTAKTKSETVRVCILTEDGQKVCGTPIGPRESPDLGAPPVAPASPTIASPDPSVGSSSSPPTASPAPNSVSSGGSQAPALAESGSSPKPAAD